MIPRLLHASSCCLAMRWVAGGCFFFLLICGLAAQTVDEFAARPDQAVMAVAVQPDGNVLVGGEFTSVNGTLKRRLARLRPDGSLDRTFSDISINNEVHALALQPDGKVILGGMFTSVGSQPRYALARLLADGKLDTSFNVVSFVPNPSSATRDVQAIVFEPDGHVLVAGTITTVVNGRTITGAILARFNTNGIADNSLTLTGTINGPVSCLAIQPDGKILVGGVFTTFGSKTRQHLARILSNGDLDLDFNVPVLGASGGTVTAIAVQPDASILLGGNFVSVAGQPRTNVARIDASGVVDPGFAPAVGSTFSIVESLALQCNGKILVGGTFSTIAGGLRRNFGRLNADGSLDDEYLPGPVAGVNGDVYGLTVGPEGETWVVGAFTLLRGESRAYVGKLQPTELATESLAQDANSITWLRGGADPEAVRTTFEVSNGEGQWTYLGEGTRGAGGWQLNGLSLPEGSQVRARAYVQGASRNGSGWFTETVGGPCAWIAQPASRTNNAGTTASFHVQLRGSPPFHYQWWKDGQPLENGGAILGADTATLRVVGVVSGNAGEYSVVVSNAFNTVTSAVARLTVRDPWISAAAITNAVEAGVTVQVDCPLAGTPPFHFQWRRDGVDLPGANAETLVLTQVQGRDSGTYSVVVTNTGGRVEAVRMVLEVNVATLGAAFPETDQAIYGVGEQSDGRILVAGSFANVGGQPRRLVARFRRDGELDDTFRAPESLSGQPFALCLLQDGSLLLGGYMSWPMGNDVRSGAALHLRADGSVDEAFDVEANNSVVTMAEQPDGKLVLGGWFTVLKGQPRSYLGRVHRDGSLDTNFVARANYGVRAVMLDPDGRILVAGLFSTLNGEIRQGAGRLGIDGGVDLSFQDPGANGVVSCLGRQSDGKILLGGEFTVLRGSSRKYLGRMNPDGTLDESFNAQLDYYALGRVDSVAVQADGKILVGGVFLNAGGRARNYLARLLPDGRADPSFNVPISNSSYVPVTTVGIAHDGATLIAGSFTSVGGLARTNFAVVQPTDPAVLPLSADASGPLWQPGGSAPEFVQVHFESSDDRLNWTPEGRAQRFADGWRLLASPAKPYIRARGWVAGGFYGGSGWWVETMMTNHLFVPPGTWVLPNPQQGFGFRIVAPPQSSVLIEATTNLVDWLPLEVRVVGEPGSVEFSDPSAILFPWRLYRVQSAAGVHLQMVLPPRARSEPSVR